MKFSLNLARNLRQLALELSAGLKRLDFVENFSAFEIEDITINDQTQTPGDYKIRNQLDPIIPQRMIIVKQTGNALVTAGATAWSSDFVYLRNHSTTTDAIVSVIFFK